MKPAQPKCFRLIMVAIRAGDDVLWDGPIPTSNMASLVRCELSFGLVRWQQTLPRSALNPKLVLIAHC